MNKNFTDNEIPKYKKKSCGKSSAKSKHKHEYVDCLFSVEDSKGKLNKGSYCKICGKIGEMHYFIVEKIEGNYRRVLMDEEIRAKYKELPIVSIKNSFQKFI